MEKYHDLFVASTGAAAAFIGLLFVAISIQPENVFGAVARREKHVRAQRAFIALANIFFVSLVLLMPDITAKPILIIAGITLLQIVRDTYQSFRDEPALKNWRQWGLMSMAVYIGEIYEALRMEKAPDGLVLVVCILYFYGLISAWMLLQAKTDPRESEAGKP